MAGLARLGKVVCPVKVIGADPTAPHAYLLSQDLGKFVPVDYDFVSNASHFS